jgi:sialate O-acetylesterase
MIASWRREWRSGEFPFLWVQLANFMAPDAEPPAQSAWAILRDAQTATLALPKTGQAVIIDIGEEKDIHPRNKLDVGTRLALAARTWRTAAGRARRPDASLARRARQHDRRGVRPRRAVGS